MAGRIAYYGNIVTDGLVLNLDAAKKESYPGVGTTWMDISLSNTTGSLVGNPTYTDPGSFTFTGSSYVDISGLNSVNLSNNITVEFWFNPTDYLNPGAYAINLFKKFFNTTDATFNFYFAGTYLQNKLRVLATANGTWGTVSPISGVIPLNQWTHAVWTYNNGGLLYINGVSQGAAVGTGTLSLNNYSITAGNMLGQMNSIRIYTKALSQAEVTQNFNAYRTRYGV